MKVRAITHLPRASPRGARTAPKGTAGAAESDGGVVSWRREVVETPRGDFEVFRRGSGPPLAVTHLYSVYNASGDRFAAPFVPFREVFLVNLRGAGASSWSGAHSELSMATAVDDLEAIRTALGFISWDFAGHSTGGMLGLCYAVTAQAGLGRLVVVGAAASRWYNQSPECIYHPRHPEFGHMQDLIERLKTAGLSRGERARLAAERTALSLRHPERYQSYFGGGVTKEMAVRRLEYFSTVDYAAFDLRTALPGIGIPTLILVGRHDVQCPTWCSQEIHRLVPRSRLVIFEESNHYPFLEEAEAFQAAIAAFLG